MIDRLRSRLTHTWRKRPDVDTLPGSGDVCHFDSAVWHGLVNRGDETARVTRIAFRVLAALPESAPSSSGFAEKRE